MYSVPGNHISPAASRATVSVEQSPRTSSWPRRKIPAERDYDVWNRTVHASEGFDELGPLLPFNPEAETPDHDTALVRFLDQERY
jgi:hypothetical protein